MTEARPIRAEESDAFLRVLCDVFGIAYERVRSVYYGEPFYDLGRKWALFEDGEMISILSTTPLEFGWGRASGIAGVATVKDARGRGYASDLLAHALRAHRQAGDLAFFLFAEDPRVYEAIGFHVLDDVVKGALTIETGAMGRILDAEETRSIYDAWADRCANRLRRDDRRWRHWNWNLRVCAAIGDGYLCQEGLQVREAAGIEAGQAWRTTELCDWLGLRSMTEALGAPIGDPVKTTNLMGLGADEPPQMFLTDQW